MSPSFPFQIELCLPPKKKMTEANWEGGEGGNQMYFSHSRLSLEAYCAITSLPLMTGTIARC